VPAKKWVIVATIASPQLRDFKRWAAEVKHKMDDEINIQEKIVGVFQSYDSINFDPIDCLKKCKGILENYCHVNGELDPRNVEAALEACNAYGYTSNLFLQNNFSSAATSILIDGWNRLSSIQRSEKQRIYRAGLGMYLAKAYLWLGDTGAAIRWAVLTQADDLLGEHPAGGGSGKQMLQTILGMSETALAELKEMADQNLSMVREKDTDWSLPFAFAEDVVTKFAFHKTAHSQLFAMRSKIIEFPINVAYFSSLLERVNSNFVETKEKGDALEDLASYLFLLLPALTPRRNLLEETLAFESDIVIRNLNPDSNLIADLLGRHFLVECKNWESKVGVQSVGYFLHRMRLTHAHFGVIFAKSGITGDELEEKAAYSIIRKSFHEDGSICVVIDNNNLIALNNENLTFRSLLLERIERLRFGKER
jgi:hypothetical protein